MRARPGNKTHRHIVCANQYCGKVFATYDSDPDIKYCSRKCAAEVRGKEMMGRVGRIAVRQYKRFSDMEAAYKMAKWGLGGK